MKDYTVKQVWLFMNTTAHAIKMVLHQQQIPKNLQDLWLPTTKHAGTLPTKG